MSKFNKILNQIITEQGLTDYMEPVNAVGKCEICGKVLDPNDVDDFLSESYDNQELNYSHICHNCAVELLEEYPNQIKIFDNVTKYGDEWGLCEACSEIYPLNEMDSDGGYKHICLSCKRGYESRGDML